MSSLIHATITVSGDDSLLEACNARIRLLLADQQIDGEVNEHHGAGALCYDLKVKEGIPFPAFVQASQEFPTLKIAAEWVDVDAGERGAATIVDGKLAAHHVDQITTAAGSSRPVHVSIAGDGRLELALTFFRSNRGEWLGYALTADRDALLRVVRAPQSDIVELFATEGGAEWSLRWQGSVGQQAFNSGVVDPPLPVEKTLYSELEQMAEEFVAEWMWFASGSREEIVIEKEYYERAGHAIHAANVKASRLHKMRREAQEDRNADGLRFCTLAPDDNWIVDVVSCAWAAQE